MSNTNAFLLFGTALGANVESDSGYLSDSQRSAGVQTGPARSAIINKALRQASSAAAMIGQFTADYGPSNVNDDGNTAAYEAQFLAAIRACGVVVPIIPTTTWYVDASSGTDDVLHGKTSGAGAFRSLQYAVNYIKGFQSVSPVTINCASGSYFVTIGASLISSWNIVGSGVGSCNLASASAGVNSGYGIFATGAQTTVTVTGFTISGVYSAVFADATATIYLGTNTFVLSGDSIAINANANSRIYSAPGVASTYTYSGSTTNNLILAHGGGGVQLGTASGAATFVAVGSPVLAGGWVGAFANGIVESYPAYSTASGTIGATTPRYTVTDTGFIGSNGGGTSYFPGTTPGYAQNTFNYGS